MEGLYFNSTSQNQSYNYSYSICNYQSYINITVTDYSYNFTSSYYDYSEFEEYCKKLFIVYVVTCIIIAIGLPLILVAIYALYSMVRSDHVAPIYLINLLITDLLQLCFMIVEVAQPEDWKISEIFFYFYLVVLVASVNFMVCISLERYLVIAHPLWYHFGRTIKSSVVVCVLVWVISLVFVVLFYFVDYLVAIIMFVILQLLPFPPLIFSLVGTLKALSATISVPSDQKRRIVGILVLVLLIYTLLFLPNIIFYLEDLKEKYDENLDILSFIFVKFSPLADSVLYVFMRKGFIDKLLASVCCCRMDSNDISRSSV